MGKFAWIYAVTMIVLAQRAWGQTVPSTQAHETTAPAVQSGADVEVLSTGALLAEVLEAVGEGRESEPYLSAALDRGMIVALAVAEKLDEKKQAQSNELLHMMAHVGRARRSQPELLRLYDPAAYRTFYSAEREQIQTKLGAALQWETWPHYEVIALVRTAPLPTLAYLRKQAASEHPNQDHVRQILREWSWWVRTGYERQHLAELHAAIGTLAKNSAVTGDAETAVELVRAIGDTGDADSTATLIEALAHREESVRTAAANTMLRLVSAANDQEAGALRAALVERLAKETSPAVLAALAEGAEAFGTDSDVGQALQTVFARTSSAAVKRSILFTAGQASWPQREALVLAALRDEDAGTVAAALQAVSARPIAKAAPTVILLLDAAKSPQAVLIDAAGAVADPRATRELVEWVSDENPVIRLKVDLALGRIAELELAKDSAKEVSPRSAKVLLDQLSRETSQLVVPQLIAIVARLHLAEAEKTLISLSMDTTAPLVVRTQAVWALGKFDTAEVRKTLQELHDNTAKYFADPREVTLAAGSPERLEQARLFIATSRMQLGMAGARDDADRVYREGTPTTQLTLLMLLSELKLDHPAIEQGLHSTEFAILLAAIKAAGTVDPVKYHPALEALAHDRWIQAVADSGLDTLNFKATLQAALAVGAKGGRP